MDIYEKSDVDAITSTLELKDNEHYTIDVPDLDNTYFDGYANVYDANVHVFTKNSTSLSVIFESTITHEALCYYANGE